MQVLEWAIIGACAVVVILGMTVLAIGEVKRIHYARGPEDDEQ